MPKNPWPLLVRIWNRNALFHRPNWLSINQTSLERAKQAGRPKEPANMSQLCWRPAPCKIIIWPIRLLPIITLCDIIGLIGVILLPSAVNEHSSLSSKQFVYVCYRIDCWICYENSRLGRGKSAEGGRCLLRLWGDAIVRAAWILSKATLLWIITILENLEVKHTFMYPF